MIKFSGILVRDFFEYCLGGVNIVSWFFFSFLNTLEHLKSSLASKCLLLCRQFLVTGQYEELNVYLTLAAQGCSLLWILLFFDFIKRHICIWTDKAPWHWDPGFHTGTDLAQDWWKLNYDLCLCNRISYWLPARSMIKQC